jgi:hypothetical protein
MCRGRQCVKTTWCRALKGGQGWQRAVVEDGVREHVGAEPVEGGRIEEDAAGAERQRTMTGPADERGRERRGRIRIVIVGQHVAAAGRVLIEQELIVHSNRRLIRRQHHDANHHLNHLPAADMADLDDEAIGAAGPVTWPMSSRTSRHNSACRSILYHDSMTIPVH